MSFENQIQQWVSIDNQIKLLNEKTKDLRNTKNELSNNITNYAKSNNLSNSTIEIGDGKLKFINTKQTEPITLKYLEKTLGEVIKNESQVKIIMEHIKSKRESKIVPEIKRYFNN
jgi:hypothetical protein